MDNNNFNYQGRGLYSNFQNDGAGSDQRQVFNTESKPFRPQKNNKNGKNE